MPLCLQWMDSDTEHSYALSCWKPQSVAIVIVRTTLNQHVMHTHIAYSLTHTYKSCACFITTCVHEVWWYVWSFILKFPKVTKLRSKVTKNVCMYWDLYTSRDVIVIILDIIIDSLHNSLTVTLCDALSAYMTKYYTQPPHLMLITH